MNLLPFIARRRSRERSRGQSLAEFALVVPLILFITLIALDFGRVYLGYINLQNMARIAANYASNNATALANGNPEESATYQAIVGNDASATNCRLPLVAGVETAPDPTFPTGTDFGDTAAVTITCSFSVITPFIAQILGNTVDVTSSAVFPIRTGQMATDTGGGPITPIPNPAFSADNTYGTSPRLVQFHDESGGFPTEWLWDFGDGETSTLQDPTHEYVAEGAYTVTLTVSNGNGTSDPLIKTNYVTVIPAADIAFTANPLTVDIDQDVSFTDESEVTDPTDWLWEFGDGETSTSQNPTHSYDDAGTYDVTLTVTNAVGSESLTKAAYITVNVPTCQVPTLAGVDMRFNAAEVPWKAAGFTTVPIRETGAPKGNFYIGDQSITGTSIVPCDSVIELDGIE